MKVKMILPALTEAKSPFWRPIKYSLFPPLGLATLAGYLRDDDEVAVQDEHVETLDLDDDPDLVVIQVYITSAKRSYAQGIETATFHLLTPYPGTALYRRMAAQERLTSDDWDLFDTRHVVFHPAKMSAEALEAGYRRAYRDFYRWSSIFKGAWTKDGWFECLRHIGYAAGWKKFEPLWDWVIRARRAGQMLPALEAILTGFGSHPAIKEDAVAEASRDFFYDRRLDDAK